MIGLDTNVLVRYLTQDDPGQTKKVNALFEDDLTAQTPGYITVVTLIEVAWVLESCYGATKQEVEVVIHELLTTKQLLVESADKVYLALKRCEGGKGDFSDAVITVIAEEMGCERVVTFDKKAVRVGMELL